MVENSASRSEPFEWAPAHRSLAPFLVSKACSSVVSPQRQNCSIVIGDPGASPLRAAPQRFERVERAPPLDAAPGQGLVRGPKHGEDQDGGPEGMERGKVSRRPR